MRTDLSKEYLAAATAAGRRFEIRVDTTRVESRENPKLIIESIYGDDILSLKMTIGKTSGGFSIGDTTCGTLTGVFTNNVNLKTVLDDNNLPFGICKVYVRFFCETDWTEWSLLGAFYFDSVSKALYTQTLTAYDAMLRYEKTVSFHELAFPAAVEDVLEYIGYGGADLVYRNDIINTAPSSGQDSNGETKYFTKRDIMGYLAAANAANAVAQNYFVKPTETNYVLTAKNIISQTISDETFEINDVVWNDTNERANLSEGYTPGTIEFSCPLDFANKDEILERIKSDLVGLSYDNAIIKRQGVGDLEIGDLITYIEADGTRHKILIMGIVYDFSNGAFTETLYSLAQSASQQTYGGSSFSSMSGSSSSAYTRRIDFKDGGFDLTFVTGKGLTIVNEFRVITGNDGEITEIINTTMGRSIVINYD